MKNKFLKAALSGAVLLTLVAPAVAQEGEGGIIIEGNFGGDPASLNALLASDTTSTRITNLLFPGFVNVDPSTANYAEYSPEGGLAIGGIVQDWEVDDTGTVYTFNLRQDLTWNDGEPITSEDVLYTWGAVQASAEGIVDSPRNYVIDPSGESGILSVEAIDDYTVEVTYATAECTALGYAGALAPVPAHVLPADYSELNDAEYNLAPTVSAGAFAFSALNPSEQVALVGDDTWFDAPEGGVGLEGFIYSVVPDQTVVVEQFLAGETNIIDTPAVARREEIRGTDAQTYDFAGNSWDYLAMNTADPSNPQSAYDAEGNPIDQGSHPIFGDVRVRQALALAVDVDAIIDAAVFGEGERMTSFIVPASWAYASELPPLAFDPDAAAALLEEAGWVDSDGDGVREASGAEFAEDGTPLSFTLFTNNGNTRRTAVGTIVQDQLAQIGVQVDFQTIDFNTLLDLLDSQTFDAAILGWRNGYPDDPDATQLFSDAGDVVGAGSNFTSYNNETFNDLNIQAKSLAGCDQAERAAIYAEMQEIFQQDVPYIPLFVQNGFYAAGPDVEGFSPYPSQLFWNVGTWTAATP